MNEILRVVARRLRTFWKWPTVTVEYPYVSKLAPLKARAGLRNNFNECIGCHQCEKACPVQCIDIESTLFLSMEKTPKTSKGVLFEQKVTSFKIDFSQCVLCGICINVCPTQSLTQSKDMPVPRTQARHLTLDLTHLPRTLRREQGYEE